MKTIKEFIYSGELEVERENREEILEALEAFNFFVISDESGKLEDRIFPFLDSLDEYEKELLANYRHITQILSRRAAARIQSSLDNSTGDLSDLSEDDLNMAADLVTNGYLTEDLMKKLTTKIKSSWSFWYYPSIAEVRCAAALAVTGHLTEVENMNLRYMELTGIKAISSLARVVRQKVELSNVTGDVATLLSSLTCTELRISNMELNQAATSGLVQGLQHGVEGLVLGYWGPVTFHIQTLVEYDGTGRCNKVVCYGNTAAPFREEIKTWAGRINWDLTREWRQIVMRRHDD